MSLAGIAIAIGTMVDMGIVLTENMVERSTKPGPTTTARVDPRGAAEVAPAVTDLCLTTVVSFLPVFALTAAEGKLFRPLAYTKTFALIAAFGSVASSCFRRWCTCSSGRESGIDPRLWWKTLVSRRFRVGAYPRLGDGRAGLSVSSFGQVWIGLFVIWWACCG